jgi:hypothetical protein
MTTVEALDEAYSRISKSWHTLSLQDKRIALIRLNRLEEMADSFGQAGRSLGADIRALKGLIEIAIEEDH